MDLFLEPKTTHFEKIAAEVTLPEDPTQWQTEILQEIYKQAPYIADFEPNVVMDRIDAERGLGFGHVEIGNKTELQVGAGDAAAHVAGIRHVRIPIIVVNRKLQAFDTLITEGSKMMPLTERRLRRALFRPQVFDVTSRTPGDQSLISALYPPYRQNYGFGGGGAVMSAGMGKEGSATLLQALLPTINETDYNKVAEVLQDRGTQIAYRMNKEATARVLALLAQYEPVSKEDRLQKIAAAMPLNVVQFCRYEGAYAVKTASAKYWEPALRPIDRGSLVKIAGVDTALLVDKTGSATVSMDAEPIAADSLETETPKQITEFGIYKVKDLDGNELLGFVFPNLMDIHGDLLPMCLFTNGAQTALQGEIAGVRVGEGANVITGRPRGYGAFYKVLPDGKAQAMVPMELDMNFPGPVGQVSLMGKTVEGTPLEIQIQPNIQKPVMSDEQHLLIPDDWRWMSLEQTKAVSLMNHPDDMHKAAEDANWSTTVTIRGDANGSFSLSGPMIDKVAQDERSFLDADDAVFYLTAMGLSPTYATAKLAESVQRHAPVTLSVTREISPVSSVMSEAKTAAASWVSKLPLLRRDLVKEAAFLPDPMAVDTALSLGFLNPENLTTFITYLPQLDETQANLCELLIAARLGLREVSVGALERAIRANEEVIEGLNVLAFQKN